MVGWGMETHGRPPRLRGWDYSRSGWYFVTFVVAGRMPVLRDGGGGLSQAGRIVVESWNLLPALYPRVCLDELAVMPDHVHALLRLGAAPEAATPLGEVVRGWKARASRLIRNAVPGFGWQSHYQDWVIRDQAALDRVRSYIRMNLAGLG